MTSASTGGTVPLRSRPTPVTLTLMRLPGFDALAPTLTSRLQALAGDGRFRSVRVRRAVALMLVLAAAALMIASQREPESPPLIVAATDLRPGTVLTADHLTARPTPARFAPDGAVTTAAQAIGKRLTGPMRRGEVITDTRLLISALPESLTGKAGARLVPVRPADESVANLVQQGDVVDVLDAERNVLATDAVVAVAPSNPAGRSPGERTAAVVLAMDQRAAQRVAAGGLGTALALILH